MKRKSFTLIELLLVMILISILAVLLVGNFNATLKRGRDSQRKNDLSQLQKALELYYETNQTYPKFNIFAGPAKKFCTTVLCDVNDTVYMVKAPADPVSSFQYVYSAEPTPAAGGPSSYYYIYSHIENALDQGYGVSLNGYIRPTGIPSPNPVNCDVADSIKCRYYVGSSNAPVLSVSP